METIWIFLLKASTCIALFYAGYLLFFRNDTNFKIQRAFLLSSMAFSFLIPFNPYSLRTYSANEQNYAIDQTHAAVFKSETTAVNDEVRETQKPASVIQTIKPLDLLVILKWLYLTVAILLISRILFGLYKLLYLLYHAQKSETEGTTLYLSPKIDGSTNLFGFIFLHPALLHDPKHSQIILHENIHASQYHSIDILLVELLAAAMWFNPVVWLMRRSLQQIHEYLADDGVLRSGVNRLEYQELLINHIAEDSLVLSSGFNSSIKKRFIMMTKTNANNQTKSKLLTLLPLIAILIAGVSFMNAPAQEKQPVKTQVKFVPPQTSSTKVQKTVTPKQEVEKTQPKVKFVPPVVKEEATPQDPPVAAISLSAMNVMYLGIDNPVTIAVANYNPKDIKVTMENGSILKKDGDYYNYIARPKTIGMASLLIYTGEKLIQKAEFRVKRVPDPVAMIGNKKGGEVSKDFLLSQDEVLVVMENFDFKTSFKITEFTFSTHQNAFLKDIHTKSNQITQEMKNLITQATCGQKIYFLDIKCTGPDGAVRELLPLVFKID